MDWIRRSWRGEERLWKVYWFYAGLAGLVVALLSFIFSSISTSLDFVGSILQFVYFVWAAVALWRCAFNAEWSGWGYLTRGIVIGSVFFTILGYGCSFLFEEDMLATPECRMEMQKYFEGGGTDPQALKTKCLPQEATLP